MANRVLVYSGTAMHRMLAREARLRSDGLVHGFDFAHREVEHAYRLVVDCLRPWHEVDISRRRLEFQLDNAPAGEAEAGRAGIEGIERDANARLAEFVGDIISQVERHPDEEPTGPFGRALHERVTAEAAGLLAEIGQVRRELETRR